MSEGDELLDEAVEALRDEAREAADPTLARILEGIDGDRLLDEAAAALRAAPETADAEATLARVLASLRAARARPRWHLAAAAAAILALAIGAPTAWAWQSGRLPAMLSRIGLADVAPPAPPAPPREPPRASPDLREPAPAPEVSPPRPADPPPVVPEPAEREAPRARPDRDRPPPAETPVEAPAEDGPETRSFAAAHDAHFRGGDPHVALSLWDAHLARHPRGRFELEARYNRALALVRLGRLDEARAALEPFARGEYGAYRRGEAERLVAAIDARGAP